jgi:uncharacterized protein YdeI (YjbR/CyaY-like superfamily)
VTTQTAKPRFFASGAAFREWLERHHANASELLLGFYKVKASKKGITYREALDEALAFGWIDAVRRGLDEERYTIRFTPRKRKSIWSKVNIKRVGELKAAGRMHQAGLAAFANRDEARSGIYSYERQIHSELDPASMKMLKADHAAFEFFERQAPGYRKVVAHWVGSAKKAETRERRLAKLIECCREGRKIPPLAY